MQVVNFWKNLLTPHELNSDVLRTFLALLSPIYDRQELFSLVFWDSNGSHQKRRSFHVLCVHMTIAISLSQFYHYSSIYRNHLCCSVYFQPLPALLIPTSLLEASCSFRMYRAVVFAVWYTMKSVVYWNHSTSLQVPYSLQHPMLVWL